MLLSHGTLATSCLAIYCFAKSRTKLIESQATLPLSESQVTELYLDGKGVGLAGGSGNHWDPCPVHIIEGDHNLRLPL